MTSIYYILSFITTSNLIRVRTWTGEAAAAAACADACVRVGDVPFCMHASHTCRTTAFPLLPTAQSYKLLDISISNQIW